MMEESIVKSIFDVEIWNSYVKHLVFERIDELGYLYEVFADCDRAQWKEKIRWCEENNTPAITTSLYFHFMNEEDAMAFKLRW